MAFKSTDSLSKESLTSNASSTTLTSQTQSQTPALTGSCQCGNVKYSSTVLPKAFTNCHCSTCRKLSGAPYITLGDYPISVVTFSGPIKSSKSSDVAIRQHCAECGSPISIQYLCEPEGINLTAGTIDEESVRGTLPKVKQCIFVPERMGAWYDVDEKVPRFARFSSGMQKKIDIWRSILMGPGLG